MYSTVLRVLFALSLLVAALPAQEFRATISGAVTDQQGALVPNATVEIRNLETNVAVTQVTNESGNYVAPFLVPGRYTIAATATGFKRAVRNDVELRVGDRVRVDLQMEIGAIAEQVTVAANAELLETSTASNGQVVDSAKVADLPLLGRNPLMLTLISSGVQNNPVNRGGTGYNPYDNGGMDMISINGGRTATNEILLDGVPNTGTESQTSNMAFVPSPDATAEFKVQTNSYDAQYGRTGGGIVNMTLKSGTNRLHGNVYHYFRNDVLNANNFETNLVGGRKDSVRWNQPGIELDGPLYLPRLYNGRDRTFFMYSWEAIRNATPYPQTWSVPTPLQRGGDFSKTVQANGSPIIIYDPLTTVQSGSNFTRQAFPGNLVPQNRMDPVALKSLPYIPLPNVSGGPTGANNLIASPNPYTDTYDQHVIRIDHSLNNAHRFFSRYVRGNRHQAYSDGGFPDDSRNMFTHWRTNQGGNFDLTSALSPSLVLSSRAGYIRHQSAILMYGEGFDATQLGFPAALISQLPKKSFPRYTFGSDFSGVGPGRNQGSEFSFTDTWSWSETVNKVAGPHSLKFGGEFRVMFNNREKPTSSFGTFAFTRGFTQRDALRGDAASGNGLASFLLGYPNSGSVPYNVASALSNRYYVLFLQDDWRVSRNLTLNLGLRWDYESPQTERYNRQNRGFDATAANPFQVPGMPLEGGLLFTDEQHRLPYARDLNNIQPRAGLAWQFARNSVLRGGYGISYLPTFDTGLENGFSVDTPFVASVDGGIRPYGRLSNPYDKIVLPPGRSGGLATLVGNGVSYGYFDRTIPLIHQFSLGIQRELPGRLLIDASYVGTRGRQLQTAKGINNVSAEQLQLGTGLVALVPNPFANLLPGTAMNGATITRQSLLRPFPQFTGVTEQNRPIGKSWYNSFQLRAEKRLSHGFHFLGSYTLSKSLEAVSYMNGQDRIGDLARVLTALDVPHRLVASGSWEPPFFKTARGPVKALLGGWQLNTIFVWQSGIPIGTPGGAYSTGLDPKLPKDQQSRSHWFNTCTVSLAGVRQNCISPAEPVAFTVQPPYTLATLSNRFPNIRTAVSPKTDVSIFKAFALREGLKLQFRAEAFNVANTPMFGAPNTSLGAANFGVVASAQANEPRTVQLSLKLRF